MKKKEYTIKATLDENEKLVIETNIKGFRIGELLGILEYIKFKLLKQDEG